MTDRSHFDHSPLAGKHVVVALTGGVACYKTAELIRLLVKSDATVQVVMSKGAEQFITPLTLQALSGRPVFTSTWDAENTAHELNGMPHINLSRQADAILIAPASADVVASLAHGRAHDLISLLCLARPRTLEGHQCPLLIAPAMNREMWSHPATQRNIQQVRADGATILGPSHGSQACGEFGDGRMLEAQELHDALEAFFQPQCLEGQRVLITAGPTFEPLDPVRGITNHSSGKMGFALARAAQEAGATVTLISGPVHLKTPAHVHRVDVLTAQDMLEAVMAHVADHDVFIATAAVADWRPKHYAAQKMKKTATAPQPPVIELMENTDILAAVAQMPSRPLCIGFAAESEHLAEHARAKLARKKVDLIVGNLGPAAFGQDDNALLLVDQQSERQLPSDGSRAGKLSLARALVQDIAARLQPPSKQRSS